MKPMEELVREHFKKADPKLFAVLQKTDIFPLRKSDDLFSDLCDHIVSQQLSVHVGNVIFGRFKKLFPNEEIIPQMILQFPFEDIKRVGLSATKVTYLQDLARHVVEKKVDLQKLHALDDEEVIHMLLPIKGIGRWTCEMFLMSSLGREDVFSYGDLGIRKAIQNIYEFEKQPTQEEAEKISSLWRPYRTYACRILWKSLTL